MEGASEVTVASFHIDCKWLDQHYARMARTLDGRIKSLSNHRLRYVRSLSRIGMDTESYNDSPKHQHEEALVSTHRYSPDANEKYAQADWPIQ